MCNCNRRSVFLGLPATALFLAGCMKQTEGTEEIHYGREPCAMCGMIISDPHFASEIRGGPQSALAKFDDVGDAVNWLAMSKWTEVETREFWVMNSEDGQTWLDARTAFYLTGTPSPMGYGFSAVSTARAGALSFAEMQKKALARGLTSRCPPAGENAA